VFVNLCLCVYESVSVYVSVSECMFVCESVCLSVTV